MYWVNIKRGMRKREDIEKSQICIQTDNKVKVDNIIEEGDIIKDHTLQSAYKTLTNMQVGT